MNRLADAVIVLWGWRRYALAAIAGAATALAFAPYDFWPVGWITFPIFVWLIDGSATPEGTGWWRRHLPAAAAGWWFGFGFFLSGLWWIGAAFLVEADTFAWLLPVAVVALPAGLALFWALGAILARIFWTDGWSRLLVFAAAMTAAEWARGHLLTGLPWNAIGYAFASAPVMMQSASLFGLWGLTLVALLVFAAPALLASAGTAGRGRWVTLAALGGLLAADLAFGIVRLRSAEDADVAGVTLRIVQPAIPQATKIDGGEARAIFEQTMALTDPLSAPDGAVPTHFIWPETAVPFLLTEEPGALSAVADLLPPGTTLIAGAPRAEPRLADEEIPRFFNSIYVVEDTGEIAAAYDKVHLVPFGEYLPLADTLTRWGVRQIIPLPGGFSPGASRHVQPAGTAPGFSPLICYEAIFPGEVVPAGSRPGWLLNVTNDGWYGDTPGPRQHFRQAALRSVEEGLPMVRAANSGISAIVDPYGRIRGSLGVGQRGVVDGALPTALPPTLYARFGDMTALAMLFMVAAIAVVGGLAGRAARN